MGDGALVFGSPRRWSPVATLALFESGRFQPVTLKMLSDVGVRHFCWLLPGEQLRGIDGQLLPADQQPDVPHGGFAYLFHDDVLETQVQDLVLDRYFPIVSLA